MGMFNTIVADIPCPETGKLSKDTEIQIKWQDRDARVLDVYRTGNSLPDLLSKYNNTWVRTDYICNACSPKTTGYKGVPYIRSDDQRWHIAFVEIKNGRVCRVFSEAEFQELEVSEFTDDVWSLGEIAGQTDPCVVRQEKK